MPSRSFVPVVRRSLLLVATLAVFAMLAVSGVAADGFDDVPADHTFAADIDWLADEGITRGCNPPTNTRFCPDDFVTRGQMAAFLVRALSLPPAGDQGFTDSAGTFEANIDSLAAAGITRGCNPPSNTRFCPDDFVTRGQMAAFLVRALGLPVAADQGFTDSAGTFKANIDSLAAAGITRGCNPPTNTRFCPDDFVTRGQMAAFLHRALTLEVENGVGAVEVSAGFRHTCAVSVDANLYCWGANGDGQLGVAGTIALTPTKLSAIQNVVTVSAGGNHTCAVTAENLAYCWGQGANGRLGNGSDASTSTPTQVIDLTEVAKLDSGQDFSCAVLQDGTVWCWGFGEGGRLGQGDTASSDVPVKVMLPTDSIVGISVGYSHACAVSVGGDVWCWGDVGRAGDGSGASQALSPTQANITNVIDVKAGHGHTCALKDDDSVACWGNNSDGQLGTGDTSVRPVPTPVPGMTGVSSIEAGQYASCATKADGSTWCWGRNDDGALGTGTAGGDQLSPVRTQVADAAFVDHAYDHACAVSRDGELTCWGDNTLGQLGIGSSGGVHASPQAVTLPE